MTNDGVVAQHRVVLLLQVIGPNGGERAKNKQPQHLAPTGKDHQGRQAQARHGDKKSRVADGINLIQAFEHV